MRPPHLIGIHKSIRMAVIRLWSAGYEMVYVPGRGPRWRRTVELLEGLPEYLRTEVVSRSYPHRVRVVAAHDVVTVVRDSEPASMASKAA